MSTVTAIVHTKNSEKTLQRCLSSLKWCDEIFVVDMGSTDDTVAIAKKHTTTIFSEKPIRFADPIRNQYMKKVETDWTLIVDSDEEVPPTLAKKFQELSLVQGINGYKVPRANIIFGKWMQHTGFWPDYIIRFFRTGTCTYPPYVHGQPVVEGVTEEIPATQDFALIHHHYESVEQYLMRLNVYTTLEVEKKNAGSEVRTAQSFLRSFFDEFYRRFYQQQGYKDGSHGLVVSLLQAIYMMVVEMKLWERERVEIPVTLDDIEYTVHDACRSTTYWVANEKIAQEKNVFQKFLFQFRRKMNS